ncbi:TPA: hypothetical protein ACNIQM_002916 [Citrobacter werkmanii]
MDNKDGGLYSCLSQLQLTRTTEGIRVYGVIENERLTGLLPRMIHRGYLPEDVGITLLRICLRYKVQARVCGNPFMIELDNFPARLHYCQEYFRESVGIILMDELYHRGDTG